MTPILPNLLFYKSDRRSRQPGEAAVMLKRLQRERLTCNERSGFREIAIFKIGVIL
jgi:hypothetical protein